MRHTGFDVIDVLLSGSRFIDDMMAKSDLDKTWTLRVIDEEALVICPTSPYAQESFSVNALQPSERFFAR
jgi:hypothetical protein